MVLSLALNSILIHILRQILRFVNWNLKRATSTLSEDKDALLYLFLVFLLLRDQFQLVLQNLFFELLVNLTAIRELRSIH